MTQEDIERIEVALSVKLPAAYRTFVTAERNFDEVDESSVYPEADLVIDATKEFRTGVGHRRPWPDHLVNIGDEADACPYVLDCLSGQVVRVEKGNLDKTFERFGSFEELLKKLRHVPQEVPLPKMGWLQEFWYYNSTIVLTLLTIFVVLPAIVFSIGQLFKWLFRW